MFSRDFRKQNLPNDKFWLELVWRLKLLSASYDRLVSKTLLAAVEISLTRQDDRECSKALDWARLGEFRKP